MAQSYTVQSGDTLGAIAKRFNVGMDQISGYKSGNQNLIYAGETLTIGTPDAPAAPTGQPASPSQVTPFLNATQEAEFVKQNSLTNPYFAEELQTPDQIEANVRTQLETDTPIPTAPNFEETYSNLRQEFGLSDIEANIAELKKSKMGLEAVTRQRTQYEEGRQVSMGVIAGRISETERQAREDMDFIDRQISYQTEQVQAGYNIINTVMNLKKMDFDTSMELYNTEFNKNKTIYEAVRAEQKDTRDFKQRLIERAEDNAKTNLQTYANLIMKGNMRYADLSQDQKLEIAKLEVQSGFGIGFMSKLHMSPQDSIISTSQRVDPSGNKYVDTIIRNEDGSTRVESTLVGKEYVASMYSSSSSASSAASKAADAAAKAVAAQQEAFWDTADSAKAALRNGSGWGEVWNSFKARFPSATNAAIDAALGVPADWINSEEPGWKWWYNNM